MSTFLRDALADDTRPSGEGATIVGIHPTDGTVTIDLGGGRVVPSCIVIQPYQPSMGAVVEALRRDETHWMVIGPRQTAPPPTLALHAEWPISYDVRTPVTAANPLVVSAAASRSWRDADGWSGAYAPTADAVGQGAYSTAYGYYRGCYFYGDGAFASLAGRSCTSLTIHLHRLGVGGHSAATQQVIGPHVHGSQPAGDPFFPWGAANVGSLAWGASGDFALPPSWGDLLISGQAKGIGHLLFATGNGNYSWCSGVAADSTSGRLTLGWA